jgi:hypothetical protein
VTVAHTCNPSNSGGRDQEDQGPKPAWANSLQAPISKKNPSQKRTGGVTQGIGPEFKPQYCKKKKKRNPVAPIYKKMPKFAQNKRETFK